MSNSNSKAVMDDRISDAIRSKYMDWVSVARDKDHLSNAIEATTKLIAVCEILEAAGCKFQMQGPHLEIVELGQ